MNSPLKVDFPTGQKKRPVPHPKRADRRAHYADLTTLTLSSIVKHRWFVLKCVAVAFVLACISMPLIPRKYTAEALIYPNLFASPQDKVVAKASVDGSTMINGEARAIRSDAILRAAARRLGYGTTSTTSRSRLRSSFDWLRATWLPETLNRSPFDRAVARLRNKLVVMNDTRSYLISVSFAASSAEEAANVVNTVVTEYLRDKIRQRRLGDVIAGETELQEQLAVYGEKHPKTMQAAAALEAERTSLEAVEKPQDGDQSDIAGDQSVKLAVPNHTPTSPKGFVIFGLSLLAGLLIGIGVAVRRGRAGTEGGPVVDCQLPLR